MTLYEYPLLIEKYTERILSTVQSAQTCIIKGPTGCGKSTFIPWLFREHRVAIVEPRRIAVTSLYNTLAPHIPTLGYKMRFKKKMDAQTTMCIYTDGAFLNENEFSNFDYIIIDEVHERSVRTDILLTFLHAEYRNKLILMSATVDVETLERFFRAKTLSIPGKSNPLELKYLDRPTSDYIVESYMCIRKIIKERPSDEKKDILVFLPGEEDINDLYQLCRRIPGIDVLKMFSEMRDAAQMKIYEDSTLTRVILSTNICETSLTIPNVKYVIDTGLRKIKVYDGVSRFGIEEISGESADQRAGRCNRIGPGVCYRLFTEFSLLRKELPEIVRCDLATPLLYLLRLNKNIFKLRLLTYPSISSVALGLEYLLAIGCVEMTYKNEKVQSVEELERKSGETCDYSSLADSLEFKITRYGTRISYYPFDVQFAHFYDLCIANKIGYYGSVALSLMSQDNYNFLVPSAKPDILTLVDLYERYADSDDKNRFCTSNKISVRGMEISRQMMDALNKSKDGGIGLLEKVFSDAFAHNRCVRNPTGSYTMERNGIEIFIHPSSSFFKRKDKHIVVVSVFCTTKNYARIVGRFI